MPWGSIRGHDRVVAELRRCLAQGRFPHALLFAGPEGIGKHAFARRLAQALLCERRSALELEPCGTCPSCVQVVAGSHPDVLTVARPEDKHELPIEAIRRLCLDLGLKPMRGTRRVAIVDDADDLSEEASNAFLKTLEEPPPGAVLILIGTSPELQLDTILSRCRVVRFEPLSEEDLRAVLLEQHIAADLSEAGRLAALGEGSASRAAGLADPELSAFRRALIEEVADARGFDAPALSRKVEAFVAEAGKESALRRERASLLVGELARLFRSVLRQTSGVNDALADPADRSAVAALSERLEPDRAIELTDRCLLADYHIARRANLPLILDALLHDLAKLLGGG